MENVKRSGVRAFLLRKNVRLSPSLYFVKTMSSMALGLFASLLMGTIFKTLAAYIPFAPLALMSSAASAATGAVLGVSIAYALEAPPLVLFSAGAVGYLSNAIGIYFETSGAVNYFGSLTGAGEGASLVAAGPLGAFLCTIFAVECGKLVSKETKVDILVTPFVTIAAGVLLAVPLCPAVAWGVKIIGDFVSSATAAAPLLMGILISVVVGMILTLPISSAAICAMIGISGIAGGAATAGCCAQMIGFAVISFRENRFGGLVAQGLGTSMLQMGNIVKNPRIWIPATLASAITGPISTCLFQLKCSGVSAGMGTCGLVGPIGIFTDMGFTVNSVIGVILVCLVLPAILSLVFSEILRRVGWIREGDMKLEL